MRAFIKAGLAMAGLIPSDILRYSVERAVYEQKLQSMIEELKRIVPDITTQYNSVELKGDYFITKVRAQQAFQMRLFERAVRMQHKSRMNVVDIGDSSGNHLVYIKGLCKDISFRTISVNLDKKAVDKVRAKGMEAVQCAAEKLDLGDEPIDLFVTFQMVEHLMNPCRFFRRLAVMGKSDYMLVTLPYRESSSVGFWTYRSFLGDLDSNREDIGKHLLELPAATYAEDEHIFELSPPDWKLLMLFSGWRPVFDEIYYQYPRRHPLRLMKNVWKNRDFEGFWGVLLKRERKFSDIYRDWDIGPE